MLTFGQGTAGQYVEFHPDYSPGDPEHRLEGAKFTIDPVLGTNIRLPPQR